MTMLLKSGRYKLIETKRHTKVLYLGRDAYAWVDEGHLSEIRIAERRIHKTDCVLSEGDYRIYDIKDEPNLTDLVHLELEVGANNWQGYLLVTGLPGSNKPWARIVPIIEKITNGQNFAVQ